MKQLAHVQSTVYYRHFSNDAFKKSKQYQQLKNTHIVTYCKSSGLIGTFNFLSKFFIDKSDSAKVIIGISDIDSDKLADSLRSVMKKITKNCDIYIHSACHVKMLSHDDMTILGSQNLSYTSQSYTANLNYKTAHYRLNEALVECVDEHQECAKMLMVELLSDPAFFLKLEPLSRVDYKDKHNTKINQLIADLREGHALDRSKANIKLAENIQHFITNSPALLSNSRFTVQVKDNLDLFRILKNMYQQRSTRDVETLLEILYGQDPFSIFFNQQAHELLSTAESLAMQVDDDYFARKSEFHHIHDHILDAPDRLEEIAQAHSLFEEIDGIIDQYELLTPEHLLDHSEDDDISAEMESPDYSSDYAMLSRDNDGNIIESVFRSKRDVALSTTEKLRLLDSKKLTHALNEVLGPFVECYLNTQYSRLLQVLQGSCDSLKNAYARDN
ncbi:hypothetical protein [Pseudomonas sp. SJZ131]|uniref:hypothetical protein n=1 Tax=Pseudomonas sp. SJZ131 TaxID=2572895 RepID=UPI00119A0FE5|nr:hypothetical protein [Pseudomonas sp. SJZ131]TWD51961.1 hypothetical protein FBY12_0473 [Pseudomonas sp. SJZ131]